MIFLLLAVPVALIAGGVYLTLVEDTFGTAVAFLISGFFTLVAMLVLILPRPVF